jgi:O-antigen ligase
MLVNLKALIVVLAIAATVFWLARPMVLQFANAVDFERRRNLWFALTAAGLLAPNFWIFAALAVPLILWGARRDTNPVALFVALLFVIPAIPIEIPIVGVNRLFDLDILRLLSLCILVPTAWRLYRERRQSATRGFQVADMFLLAFGALQVILFVPPDPATVHNVVYQNSFTNVLRSAFLFFIDVYVLYYAASRFCEKRRALSEVLATFCLACLVLAPIAVFESVRHWLLYAGISPRWGVPLPVDTYIMRGGALRAQATAGHSITLGYLFDVALGFWLYLQYRVPSRRTKVVVPMVFGAGLLVTYSRAPWLSAVAIYFVFVALGARALPRLFKTAFATVLLAICIAISPLGYRIARLLPFVGESAAADSSLQYREQLAERSWQLIQEHPFFGQQFVYPQMEDLRQGEGIIDFVNAYAQIALFYGGVGLFLFLAFVFLTVTKLYRAARDVGTKDPELREIGRSLLASMFGTLLLIASGNLLSLTERVFYVLAGLMCAYAHLSRRANVTVPSQASATWMSSTR